MDNNRADTGKASDKQLNYLRCEITALTPGIRRAGDYLQCATAVLTPGIRQAGDYNELPQENVGSETVRGQIFLNRSRSSVCAATTNNRSKNRLLSIDLVSTVHWSNQAKATIIRSAFSKQRSHAEPYRSLAHRILWTKRIVVNSLRKRFNADFDLKPMHYATYQPSEITRKSRTLCISV